MDILALVLFVLLIVLLLHVVRGGQTHFPVVDNQIVYAIILIIVLTLIVWRLT